MTQLGRNRPQLTLGAGTFPLTWQPSLHTEYALPKVKSVPTSKQRLCAPRLPASAPACLPAKCRALEALGYPTTWSAGLPASVSLYSLLSNSEAR